MKNLTKLAVTIGQILGLIVGNGVKTAGGNTYQRFPHLSFAV